MRKVEIQAPAKINLHLEVGGIRSDGFHEIRSIFQAVSLFDRITAEFSDKPGEIEIIGNFPCAVEDNLIYKAARLYLDAAADNRGLRFTVDKNIPSEAGLGGGSSDAAAVLKALGLLLDKQLSSEEMHRIARELGSDVPFFLEEPCASVAGRGEILKPVSGAFQHEGLIVRGGGPGISTGKAYAAVDRYLEEGRLKPFALSEERMVMAFLEKKPAHWPFFNSFFETFRNDSEGLEFIYKLLYDAGAVFAGLSGSGSAFFGLFPDGKSADVAERSLRGQFPFVERIYFLNSIPPAVVI